MLDFIGYILNLGAAGLLLPVILLPMACLLQGRKSNAYGTLIWYALFGVTLIGCILFASLAPRLNAPDLDQTRFALLAAAGGAALAAGSFFTAGPKGLSSVLVKIADKAVRSTGLIVMWLLLLMAIIQFGIVILRYVFGVNFIFMQESITYMHGSVFLLAGGYALLTNDHVRVDIFYRDAPPRRKALVDFLGAYLLLFPTCFVIFWAAGPYVAQAWAVMEGSTESSGIQGVFLLKSLIACFAALLTLAGFVNAQKAAIILRGDD